jgi:hypothetical protein
MGRKLRDVESLPKTEAAVVLELHSRAITDVAALEATHDAAD